MRPASTRSSTTTARSWRYRHRRSYRLSRGSGGSDGCFDGRSQESVQLTGNVAFEATDDLFLAEALLSAALDVGLGRKPCGRWRSPQGTVGVAVAATIEAVSVLAP
jgi:hypothetical protein